MDKYNEIMAELEKTEDLLIKEIRKVNAKNDLTPQELNSMKEAVCLMKDIIKLEEMMEGANKEYDEYSEYYDDMPVRSMRRGRDANTGRYVSRMHGRSMNSMNYMDTSRHSIEDRMVAKLESMMDGAGSDFERQKIGEWINKIRTES